MSDHILVTGGAGFIGAHVCKALAAKGLTPVSFDNLSTGHEWAVQWGPLERGDLREAGAIRKLFNKYDFAGTVHMAAKAYVGESVADPAKYWENNVLGSINLLLAARDAGVKRLVFSSSCTVYGDVEACPIAENQPLAPENPYGATKRAIEGMMADFGAAYGFECVAFRYFNAAGADPEGEIGEDHDPETHLIPIVLDVAAGRRPALSIFGTDYDTPDGTPVRDYIHVTDLAAAHVAAFEYLAGGGDGRAFNLGTGRGYSVREVIGAVERITGKSVSAEIAPRRPGDVGELYAKSEEAESNLSWSPQLSDLDTIIETAWNWHINHFGLPPSSLPG